MRWRYPSEAYQGLRNSRPPHLRTHQRSQDDSSFRSACRYADRWRGGYVGMVNRETFDEFLRSRAAEWGADRRKGNFERISRDSNGMAVVHFTPKAKERSQSETAVRARIVVGADGALSQVGRQPSREQTGFPSSLPITRLSGLRKRRRDTMIRSAATCITTGVFHQISTRGSFRTAM